MFYHKRKFEEENSLSTGYVFLIFRFTNHSQMNFIIKRNSVEDET